MLPSIKLQSMRVLIGLALVVALIVTGCGRDSSAQDSGSEGLKEPKLSGDKAKKELPDITFERAFPNLTFPRPVEIAHAGDGSDRLFVLEQDGKIRVFPNKQGVETASVFLDIKEKVFRGHNEEGLLAIAFHPKFKKNGYFYIYYSAGEGRGRSAKRRGILSRFEVSKQDKNRADPSSEKIILSVDQPWGNHNGCDLEFGLDDEYLYVSLGDGGAANDPLNAGQRMDMLLGKILRIDVDKEDKDNKLAYSIPKDNPFVKTKGARGEIWAYGLRNVWRMAFDHETKLLYGGDVGQNKWEEVSLIEKGGNYGWRVREGAHWFRKDEAKKTENYIDPIAEYPHSQGISITGGRVYRGKEESLQGIYFYSDYGRTATWALRYDEKAKKVSAHRQVSNSLRAITSYGEDEAGNLYVCAFAGRRYSEGKIYKIVPTKEEKRDEN